MFDHAADDANVPSEWLGVPTLPKIREGWGTRQEGESPNSGLKNIVGFEGAGGLFEDLGTGHIPAFSFIAPNQCNDQHGRGNGSPLLGVVGKRIISDGIIRDANGIVIEGEFYLVR